MTPFSIVTDRLEIRPWLAASRAADRLAFEAMTGDAEMMRFMSGGRAWRADEIDAYFERQEGTYAREGFCMGALVERASGRVMGLAGLQRLGTTGELETGYWVARDLWGLGYATEAARGALRHAFEVVGGERVLAIVDPQNFASRRVLEKVGMTYREDTTGAAIGHRMPEIKVALYGLERADWRP